MLRIREIDHLVLVMRVFDLGEAVDRESREIDVLFGEPWSASGRDFLIAGSHFFQRLKRGRATKLLRASGSEP